MNTVTHALLPVLAVRAASGERIRGRQFVGIGICGALPDLINPHLSLAARMSSWSHGLPAWAVITVLCLMIVPLSGGRWGWGVAVCGAGAYLLHLVCDAISGGINWLSPMGEAVWGEYWFPPAYWIPADLVLVLGTYLVFRAIPRWREAMALRGSDAS